MTVIVGSSVQRDGDGHLLRPGDWNENIAAELAKEEGIFVLTDRHWAVITSMRKGFETHGDVPSIPTLTKVSGVSTKELYALFPKGPAKKAAKIAGLPKPTGCI